MTNRLAVLLFVLCALATLRETSAADQTNFVIIFADDLGYGDLACYGHPTIKTPNLDRMAREGMKFTQFYAAAEVCTPSRGGLLTGRLPPRNGLCGKRRVFFPDSKGGIQADELTVAELLKTKGYATAILGKWHLGHLPPYLPTRHGFDYFYGTPYVNDMDRVPTSPKGKAAYAKPKYEYWDVPLMRNEEIIERPANQNLFTKRYSEEAAKFIREHKEQPFFLYFAHNMPHVPLFASGDFAGQSRRGLYGDTVEEIDHSVGVVLDAIRDAKLSEKTLVIFTSDNGPWLMYNQQGGSAGLLREGKGSTWEGGMREPAIAWMPGTIPAASVCQQLASTLDVLPTFCSMAGVEAPKDRMIDGYDITPALKGDKSPRQEMFFYRSYDLMAVRLGQWKAHFLTQAGYNQPEADKHEPPLLFNLDVDPGESYNVAENNPAVLKKIEALVEQHRAGMKPAASQVDL
ncbi:MAG TPA: sulfatase [Pirellulaceae bacterium]|jgi:arylsulfatase A-like enzyme